MLANIRLEKEYAMLTKTVEEYNSKIKRVLITEEEIKEAIAKVGKEISDSYDGRPILLVSILKGAFVFMADLCRAITVPCEIGFMAAKSYYAGTTSSGVVKITMDLEQDISNYHVIIVEDIIDTGRTLNDVVHMLKNRNPLSLKVVTLLDKPSRRKVDFKADVSLFTIPDHFVIGYGLDCAEYYRNLPYIAEYDASED
jgi:hypoxanthine phosphoribosyltransferase